MHGKSGQETEDVHRRNCISFVIQWLHLNTAR